MAVRAQKPKILAAVVAVVAADVVDLQAHRAASPLWPGAAQGAPIGNADREQRPFDHLGAPAADLIRPEVEYLIDRQTSVTAVAADVAVPEHVPGVQAEAGDGFADGAVAGAGGFEAEAADDFGDAGGVGDGGAQQGLVDDESAADALEAFAGGVGAQGLLRPAVGEVGRVEAEVGDAALEVVQGAADGLGAEAGGYLDHGVRRGDGCGQLGVGVEGGGGAQVGGVDAEGLDAFGGVAAALGVVGQAEVGEDLGEVGRAGYGVVQPLRGVRVLRRAGRGHGVLLGLYACSMNPASHAPACRGTDLTELHLFE